MVDQAARGVQIGIFTIGRDQLGYFEDLESVAACHQFFPNLWSMVQILNAAWMRAVRDDKANLIDHEGTSCCYFQDRLLCLSLKERSAAMLRMTL